MNKILIFVVVASSWVSVAAAGDNEWTQVGLTGAQVAALAVDPSSPSTLYAGTSAGIFKSVDWAQSWTNVNPSALATKLLVDPHSPSTVYAATAAGVLRSDDGGMSWAPKGLSDSIDTADALAMDPGATSTLYAVSRGGLFRSTDRGESWTHVGGGSLPRTGVAELAVGPDSTLFVSPKTFSILGWFQDGGRVWRNSLGGTGYWSVGMGLPFATYSGLAISGSPSSILFAATGDSLFRSLDDGVTFARVGVGLSFPLSSLTGDPSSGSVAYAGTPTGVSRTADGGQSWFPLGLLVRPATALAVDPSDSSNVYVGTDAGLYAIHRAGGPCASGPTTLCLNRERFQVETLWKTKDGRSGRGQAVPVTSDSGYFWFRTPTDVELAVKVLQGPAPERFWVFGGALTDVEYTIQVTDMQTGQTRSYHNAQGQMSSFADTSAFPVQQALRSTEIDAAVTSPAAGAAYLGQTAACAAGGTTLCLHDGRFQVDVSWQTRGGRQGAGQAVPLTTDTGYFWFFSDSNVELVIKVLDGRPINGHFWVFYGALSDVAYTITVTDTETGVANTYENPQGTLSSHGDTEAF